MKKPLKGFILAAGLGTRLRPLTDSCPKPLLPFFGIPLLYILLEQLVKLDVEEIFVNGHYLGTQIQEAIQRYPLPIKVTYCEEVPHILGTAGAIGALKDKIGNCDLVVLNGDIVTNLDLEALVNKHQTNSALATMGLLDTVPPEKTSVWCNNTHIVGIGGNKPQKTNYEHAFACAQILSPQFVQKLEGVPSEIIPVYKKFIDKHAEILYVTSNPFWSDIGSPECYLEAHLRALPRLIKENLIESLYLKQCWGKLGLSPYFSDKHIEVHKNGNVWQGPFFSLHPVNNDSQSTLGPGFINLTVHDAFPVHSKITNSLFLPNAKIIEGDPFYNHAIVSDHFRLDMVFNHKS
jgi:NDP-sugar pyrophosphorylase family protein